MKFIGQVIGVGASLWITDALLKGMEIANFKALLIAAVVLIIMNAIVKPILTLLTFPITVVTLGLFLLVVNALTYWWTASLVDGFTINSFTTAIIGALITSIISSLFVND